MIDGFKDYLDCKTEELIQENGDDAKVANFFGKATYEGLEETSKYFIDLLKPYGDGHPVANLTYNLSAVTVANGVHSILSNYPDAGTFQMIFGISAMAATEGWMYVKEDKEPFNINDLFRER